MSNEEIPLLVKKEEANEVVGGSTTIREYFYQVIPALGLATAVMKGVHPPVEEGYWLRNNGLDEFYFVVSGTGRLKFENGPVLDLVPDSAALIRKGTKFRVENAEDLYVVVPTSPAWTPEQYEILKE